MGRGLWATCQWRPSAVTNARLHGAGRTGVAGRETPARSPQFCCEPATAPERKSINEKTEARAEGIYRDDRNRARPGAGAEGQEAGSHGRAHTPRHREQNGFRERPGGKCFRSRLCAEVQPRGEAPWLPHRLVSRVQGGRGPARTGSDGVLGGCACTTHAGNGTA